MRGLEEEAVFTPHAEVHAVVDAAEALRFARDLALRHEPNDQ